MKTIRLNQGRIAIVDDDDFEKIKHLTWSSRKSGDKYYAAHQKYLYRENGKQISKCTLMHRLILNAPTGVQVDHINGDALDNRKENLRLCTPSQNQHNRKAQVNNKSGFKGVCKPSGRNRYRATIYLHNKPIRLGCFDCPIKAARAYNAAAIKYHGEFAKLNEIPA